MNQLRIRQLISAGFIGASLLLSGCGGSGSSTVPVGGTAAGAQAPQSSTRTAQYAGAVPIYASAVPIYAGAVPIYAGAVPIYAGAVPICAPVNASDAQCNAVSPGTVVIWPPGVPGSILPGLHPADLQSAYNLPSSSAGNGQTIGIIVAGDAPTAETDLGVYRSTFGLAACTSASGCFRRVDGDGRHSYPAFSNQWAIEAAIDTQIATAVCPNCKLLLVEAKSTKVRDLMTAITTAAGLGATVINNSYAFSDDVDTSSDDDNGSGSSANGGALPRGQAMQFKSPGVPFVAGTGDGGPGATWPSSASFAIAVGGTTLTKGNGTARGGYTETAWQSSGGGCTAYVAKPAWQSASSCDHRSTADVSAFADPNPGASVYVSSLTKYPGWWAFGGTSVATPIVAGAIALAGNSASLTNAKFIYDNSAGLFSVGGGSSYATGLGSPNGTAAF